MDLADLDLFLDVARRRSFAAVARDRGVDPSSVSRAVAALEARLGVRLLQRTTRAMSPTEAGELFLARAPALIEELRRIADEARSDRADPVGAVRLTASVAFGQTVVGPLLPEIRARLPRLRLELLFTDANLDLVADRVDLALRLGPSPRGDVVGERLFPTRYRVVASPRYLARAGRPVGPRDLRGHACLLFALPDYRSTWRFRDAAGAVEEVPVRGDLIFSTALALRDAALAGLGPALLADWLTRADMADGRLVDLFPAHRAAAAAFDTSAWMLRPSAAYVPRRTAALVAFFRERLGRDG